jgi:hypothetical protein
MFQILLVLVMIRVRLVPRCERNVMEQSSILRKVSLVNAVEQRVPVIRVCCAS